MSYYPSLYGYPSYKKSPINYVLLTPASGTVVSIAEVKLNARIDSTDTTEDPLISLLIDTATQFAENYTRRDFLNKTYTAYLDYFPDFYLPCDLRESGIELRRSKLQSVTSIKYYVSGVLVTFSSANYYLTNDADYSSIFINSNSAWPTDGDIRKQAIQIQFVAGYGSTYTFVPNELRLALLQHITAMYQSRGDACDGGCDSSLPATAEAVYSQYKIMSLC